MCDQLVSGRGPWEKKLCQVSGDQATGQEEVTTAQDDAPSLQSLTPPGLGLGRNCLGNLAWGSVPQLVSEFDVFLTVL